VEYTMGICSLSHIHRAVSIPLSVPGEMDVHQDQVGKLSLGELDRGFAGRNPIDDVVRHLPQPPLEVRGHDALVFDDQDPRQPATRRP
jgi:hypothetical protein